MNQLILSLRNDNEKNKEDKNKLRSTIDSLEKSMINKDREMSLYRSQHAREYE